jgi:co-chaperonin GroES (HSP10)
MTMSEIITPDNKVVGLNGKAVIPEEPKQEEKPTQLPEVKGYRLLCAVPNVEEKYQSGILKSDKTKSLEEHSTVVLFVLKMGDMAYMDNDRFPTGPWCKEGDFVITRAYSGTRIKIHGKEFRILNDDAVEAVVDDPRGYERA